ncbi:MAG: hypothetical protein ACUVT4_10185 [Actinomycetota bacterium]
MVKFLYSTLEAAVLMAIALAMGFTQKERGRTVISPSSWPPCPCGSW